MFNWLVNKPSQFNAENWQSVWNQEVRRIGDRFAVGKRLLKPKALKITTPFGEIDGLAFQDALTVYQWSDHPLIGIEVVPQFAAVAYDVMRIPQMMANYFPLAKTLAEAERIRFENTVQELTQNPNFDLKIWLGKNEQPKARPESLAYIIVGHIVEILFFRRDIIERFFAKPRYFNIYMTEKAYTEDGGEAGGCYDPQTGSIKLVASRLFEGFYQETPGVAPFIHEFGHMLDSFYANSSTMGQSRGLLPGMFKDEEIFTPAAYQNFVEGKRLEHDRYERARLKKPIDERDIPIGHPYVFQNDGEFVAGYLEMFFRNPHRFHQLNPVLYQGFVSAFKQDPRRYWKQDFSYYIETNRDVYLGHRQGIQPSSLRVFG